MEILINILIILLLYLVPLIVFTKTITWGRYSKLISIVIVFAYIGLLFIVPSMQGNILPFILIIFMMFRMKDESLNGDYYNYRFSIKEFRLANGFRYALVGYGMVIVVSIITQLLLFAFGIQGKSQEVVEVLSGYNIIEFLIAAPSAVIFAPIVEEYVFRYVLFQKIFRKSLTGKGGFLISSFLVSIIFAVAHNNITAFGMLFIISFYNCYLIEKKGYWYAVFNHFFVNLITTSFLFASKLIQG